MTAMTTMSAVHEHVQERAGKDQQERQPPKEVSAMLREKIETRNREEAVKGDVRCGEPSAMVFVWSF